MKKIIDVIFGIFLVALSTFAIGFRVGINLGVNRTHREAVQTGHAEFVVVDMTNSPSIEFRWKTNLVSLDNQK